MTERGSGRAWRLAAIVATAALAGCEEPQESPQLVGSGRDGPSVGARPGAVLPDAPLPTRNPGPEQGGVVQIAAFPDSAAAARLRDSLADAGWRASLRRVAPDSLPAWRVRVAPTPDGDVLQLVAAGWRAAGRSVQLVADTATALPPVVRVHGVNRGGRGVRAGVRWVRSPDGSAFVVVEDVVGAGGEPLPDGFLYASERRPTVMQRDSVWDVAPDPAWERIAFGRAYLVPGDGRQAISAIPWLAVASRTNLNVAAIRRGTFAVGRTGTLEGFAQPVIEPLAADSSGSSLRRAVTAPVPMAGGWRVRWSTDGRMLAVGLPPARAVADDVPPATWVAVDVESRLSRGEVPSYLRLTSVDWDTGPTVGADTDVSSAPRRLSIEGGEVVSENGWVSVRGPATGGTTRVIGPGTALAATGGGRFIAALAPAVGRSATEPARRVVVYELIR